MSERKVSMEEMLEIVNDIRTRKSPFAPVTAEELAKYPIEPKEMTITTEEGDTPVSYYVPEDNRTDAIIINFHGGGFVKGRSERDDLFCRKIASIVKCRVLDVDYKLAPEYRFPKGVYECYAVVKWVADHAEEWKVDPNKILLMGHSAGGNLITAVSLLANEKKEFKIAYQVLDYAPLDVYTDPAAKKSMKPDDKPDMGPMYNLLYCDRDKQNHYLASPVFATDEQLVGSPDTLVITAAYDALAAESEKYGLRLAAQGAEVTIRRFMDSHHGFTVTRNDEYEASTELICRMLAARI